MEETRRKTNFSQVAGMLLFLVILPAGTWLYLNSGYMHRKKALEELQDRGHVGAFELTDHQGKRFSSAQMHRRVTVAGFLPADPQQQRAWTERLVRIQNQFDHRDDVCFLLFADTSLVPNPEAFAAEYGMTDTLQWELLLAGKDELARLSAEAFHLPDLRHLALVDTGLVERRYYDILDNAQLGRLVEHLTIVMPRLPDPDIEFRREREK